ncbi:MAG: DEAD/DEAH box helicase [Candidatus Taylorbacteria bacterium]
MDHKNRKPVSGGTYLGHKNHASGGSAHSRPFAARKFNSVSTPGASAPSRFSKPHTGGYKGHGSTGSHGDRPTSGGYKGSASHGKPSYSRGGFSGGRGGGSRGGGRGGFNASFRDISKFVKKAVITEQSEVFVHEHKFVDFLIDERLKKNIVTKGYITPTPIQDKIIPHILRGSDVVGIANTGTGKTAAFLIPLIDKILKKPQEKVIIVVPTRELAIQIEQEFKGFSPSLPLWATCCVGGASMGAQIAGLSRKNTNVVIGTPGRLKDLIERSKIRLNEFGTIVLDEADRMLDMGFIADIKFMVAKMPPTKHTLFFSATMSRDIEQLISTFLKNPVRISVKTQDTSNRIDQDIVRVPAGKEKNAVLYELLARPGFDKVIIFGKTKHGVERLAQTLVSRGFKAESIHGNKSHGQRQKALKFFKEHHVNILVATDVAARGLDISGVSHVINYDLPATYDDYVHRIGRTGRANKTGKALTFV